MVDAEIKKRARKAVELLAENYGIKLSEKDYPEIESVDEPEPSYNPEKKTINIPPKEANSGIAYFEEASHALRDFVQRKRFLYRVFPSAKQDVQVQEFFGRAGETLGRKLARGTELEYLFKNEPRRDLQDKETRKRWADRLKAYKGVKGTLSEAEKSQARGREYLSRAVSENYDSLADLFIDFDSGRLGVEEFEDRFRRIDKLRKADISNLKNEKGLLVNKYDLEDAKRYIRRVNCIGDVLNIAKKMKDEKEKKQVVQMAIDSFRETYNPDLDFKMGEVMFTDIDVRSDIGIYSHFAHRKPYEFAQQYSADDLLTNKNLYALPDSKIRKMFFARRKSGLEKAVETAFFVFLPAMLAYILLNIKLTGFAISNKYNIIAGSFLGIVFFFLLIAFLCFKLKRK